MNTHVPRHRVYIGVGSNIEAEANIWRALALLRREASVTGISPFYRCPAAGDAGQPDFVNGVFRLETDRQAHALKYDVLRPLEAKLGRTRTDDKNAARPIDLDIALYADLALAEPGLVIPDPGVRRYAFVAVPLLDLAPDCVLPGTGERLKDLFPGSPESYGLFLLPAFTEKLKSSIFSPPGP